MRRLILSVVLVAVALAAQLTIVNRLVLPGGAGPDLVLLVVVALALTGGPLPGMLTGFLAGLAWTSPRRPATPSASTRWCFVSSVTSAGG